MHDKPRVIVTTDMEVDDMNSLIHLALYLNMLDVEAVVYTASQYHFQGDGTHTLAEVNPHWRTKGVRSYEWDIVPHEPDPQAGALTRYRPFPAGWIENLWRTEYAQAHPLLCANARAAGEDAFPTPEDMCARTFTGNVAFEGDVRENTPGSDVIKSAILDDDPRTLWLLSWGGMNTIVRALMSIAEDWQDTPEWERMRERVYAKVRVMGVADSVGQDNSWLDHGAGLFPELVFWRAPFAYGGYLDAKTAQQDSIELFCAPWPQRNLIEGNGPLMERYMLYGDGKHYENEPKRFQFGEHATLDWGWKGVGPFHFTPGDFMAEGDSMTYIPLIPFGLRGADNPSFDTLLGPLFKDGEASRHAPHGGLSDVGKPVKGNPNPYLRAYQEDFAARAQWCANEAELCNHAPVITETGCRGTVGTDADGDEAAACPSDCRAAAGETVALHATACDPDEDELRARWFASPLSTSYSGKAGDFAWSAEGFDATFPVPEDARPGDRFVITLAVQDAARRPMTRYAQVSVTVR